MPLDKIIGDYEQFFLSLHEKLIKLDINISGHSLSHIAYRTASMDEYENVRRRIEAHSIANVENEWNGRPISKLLLKKPLQLKLGFSVSLIELIPPIHQRIYPMGLEHIGVVIGEGFSEFSEKYKRILTGQQDQGPFCQPVYITFPDNTTVKFYRYSLKDVCEKEGKRFEGNKVIHQHA